MDYRQTYEILLKTICENDKRILQLLAHISQCDDMLLELSLQTCPNPVTLQAITLKKDRLIEQLENASADEEQYVSQLSSIASLCNEVTSHPLYLKMDLLHADPPVPVSSPGASESSPLWYLWLSAYIP